LHLFARSTRSSLGLVPQLQDLMAMRTLGLALEVWKLRLKEDCERQDKLLAYSSLGEECLKVLWETGTEPTVQGVIEGGNRAA
jgi:hypothetical protein